MDQTVQKLILKSLEDIHEKEAENQEAQIMRECEAWQANRVKSGLTWQPKPSPSWRSRAYHAAIGFLVPLIAGRLGGYSAVAWAFAGACVAGIGWELLTPVLAGPLGWDWPHGDLAEAVAVVAGAAGGASGWLIWTRSKR